VALPRGRGRPRHNQTNAELETEWCERRLLARMSSAHRGDVAQADRAGGRRRNLCSGLLQWQHVAPGTQVSGERGAMEVLRQLQGFEIPANAWERQVLARRIVDYDPKWLDQLCLTGAVGWGDCRRIRRRWITPQTVGVKPKRVLAGVAPRQRRVIPTSVAPITFFVREDADWMTPRHPGAEPGVSSGLSPWGARSAGFFCGSAARRFLPMSCVARES